MTLCLKLHRLKLCDYYEPSDIQAISSNELTPRGDHLDLHMISQMIALKWSFGKLITFHNINQILIKNCCLNC